MDEMLANTAMAEHQHKIPAGNIAPASKVFNMLAINMFYRQFPHYICSIQPF